MKRIKLKHNYFDLQKKYEKECEVLTKLSENLRKEEIENKRREHELMEQKRREEGIETEKEKSLRHPSSSSSSRRRNRADFVDDAEMENVLLQIDPNYKHYQAAATIPSLILDPVHKFSFKFCDVNNLVTDKNLWASRILKDATDNFSDHEHSLFLEGYLIHPKKFGKISHYMGGLRTPEECVLHYYRTKKTVNYRQLLIDKNKKRKMSAAAKRRKRKERGNEEEIEVEEGKDESISTADKEEKSEEIIKEIAPPVLVQVLEAKDKLRDISENIVKNTAENGNEDIADGREDTMTTSNLKRVHDVIEDTSSLIKIGDSVPSMVQKGSIQSDYYPDETRELDFNLENALQRKKHKTVPDHKTSYWSVRESQLFPELLKEFGSQWSLISEKLGTKSTTMVRNYYQRNAARNGWKTLVDETDLKRDGTSSESVHQSQILMQPERPNINAYSNIPPQQMPALGFFIGQPTHGHDTSISSTDGSTTVSYTHLDVYKRQLLTLDINGSVYIWDMINFELVRQIANNAKNIAISQHNGNIMALTENNSIIIFNLNGEKYTSKEFGPVKIATSIDFFDFTKLDTGYRKHDYWKEIEILLVGFSDGTIEIYELFLTFHNEWAIKLLKQLSTEGCLLYTSRCV